MALPKALLCALGDYDAQHEEAALRQTGFATALVAWQELCAHPGSWMQLAHILNDDSICAWVLAGEAAEATEELLATISLLALSLGNRRQPATALVFCEGGSRPDLPPLLEHVIIQHSLDPFAARLMAARFKEGASLKPPFHLAAHLDPLTGLWLEAGPSTGEGMEGFMLGALGAEVAAFGTGPRGVIPGKSTLAYPMLGIRGNMGGNQDGKPFCACAAKNRLDDSTACYCKIDGLPKGVFLGPYAEDEGEAAVVMFC